MERKEGEEIKRAPGLENSLFNIDTAWYDALKPLSATPSSATNTTVMSGPEEIRSAGKVVPQNLRQRHRKQKLLQNTVIIKIIKEVCFLIHPEHRGFKQESLKLQYNN